MLDWQHSVYRGGLGSRQSSVLWAIETATLRTLRASRFRQSRVPQHHLHSQTHPARKTKTSSNTDSYLSHFDGRELSSEHFSQCRWTPFLLHSTEDTRVVAMAAKWFPKKRSNSEHVSNALRRGKPIAIRLRVSRRKYISAPEPHPHPAAWGTNNQAGRHFYGFNTLANDWPCTVRHAVE